jgi:hypothetical protein
VGSVEIRFLLTFARFYRRSFWLQVSGRIEIFVDFGYASSTCYESSGSSINSYDAYSRYPDQLKIYNILLGMLSYTRRSFFLFVFFISFTSSLSEKV